MTFLRSVFSHVLLLISSLSLAQGVTDREVLISGLETLRDHNLGGFVINYSPTSHEGSSYSDLTIIARGGKFIH